MATHAPDPATGLMSFEEALGPLVTAPGQAAALLVSPRLAQAWAQALVMHWSRLERLGGLDLSHPLYVLDLAPADGRLACAVLAALRRELHARGMLGWPVRLLLCGRRDQADGRIAEFAAMGWLDWAHWPGRAGQPLLLGASRFPLFSARNPVAALGAGAFSAAPAELYAAHFGQVLQAGFSLRPGTQALVCDWQAPGDGTKPDEATAALLEHYRVCVASAPVMLSSASLATLDALADLSGGRYLLLAADRGVAQLVQIALGGLAAPADAAAGTIDRLVNFHALAWHQERSGARTRNLQWGHLDAVVHLACRDDVAPPDDESWETLVRWAAQGHPALRWRTVDGERAPDAERLALRLRESGHDPWTLGAVLEDSATMTEPELHDEGEAGATTLREELAACWHELPSFERTDGVRAALASLLLRLHDWPLAREVLHAASDSAHPPLHFYRARLALATGQAAAARAHLARYLRECPGDAGALQWQEALAARQARHEASRWHPLESGCGAELVLELLDAFHVDAWIRMSVDKAAAELAGLPAVASEHDALAYLASLAPEQACEFAVMHRELGFVGIAGMRRAEDMAQVHFWIATPHQGRHLGPRAMRLLCACLREHGLAHAFTPVYRRNERSRCAMQRAGFATLAWQGHGADAAFEFMHLALREGTPPESAEQLVARVERLCRALGEPLQFPTPATERSP